MGQEQTNRRLEELRERFKKEPLVRLLKAGLRDLNTRQAHVYVPANKELLIVDGIVQGGVITAVADFAGVYVAMAQFPEGHTPCSNINIHFLKQIKEGEDIYAIATVVHMSRSSVLVEVSVSNSYELAAQATMLFVKPRTEPKT